MKKSHLLVLASLISASASAFAEVSFQEKVNRVEYLEDLTSGTVAMNIDSYRRDLQYEKDNIPLEARAQIESNLMAEKIRLQVQKSYEIAIKEQSHEEAITQVKADIEKDLSLINSELRDDIRQIALDALENAHSGAINSSVKLKSLEKSLLKSITERSDFLNREGKEIDLSARLSGIDSIDSIVGSDKAEYKNKQQLIDSLVSDLENIRWVSTSNTNLKSDEISRTEGAISLQLNVEFMGVSLSAGPIISFSREFKTTANIMAEGLNPVLLMDGNFDFNKRDQFGRVVTKNGNPVKRFISFTCNASLDFASIYSGGGGFSISGIGESVSFAKSYSNSVTLTSRRIAVPEYLEGKTVTIKFLNQLCHNDFLKAHVTNTMTISNSLNEMMKNVVSGLRFSHPKTKCATDSHCFRWFNREVIPLLRLKNYPRCVEERREKYRACELRGLIGQNCTVYDSKGKRISDGMFEYKCDTGLKCVKVMQEGWFKNWEIYQYAKGVCRPIKPSSYKSPR